MKKLPKTFQTFKKKHGAIWDAHEQLSLACAEAGPLDRKTRELIKIGISVGAGLETATKRHLNGTGKRRYQGGNLSGHPNGHDHLWSPHCHGRLALDQRCHRKACQGG